jgi:hypothetical protein
VCSSTDARQPLRTGKDFATICGAAGLDHTAREVLAEPEEPRDFVGALIGRGEHLAAAGVLAHAIPTREGVFWAWSSARDAAGDEAGESAQRCLAAARAWIWEPTDEHRFAAFAAAREDRFESPASMACAAAFCSGGSLAPEDMPEVLPDPSAAAGAVRDCIVMAALIGRNAGTVADRYRAFLAEGLRIAERTYALEVVPPERPLARMGG